MNKFFFEERLKRGTITAIGESIAVEKEKDPISPIELFTLKSTIAHNEPFQFIGFNKELYPEIVNDGNSVNMNYKNEPRPRLTGGGLRYPEYMLYNIHFRWDSDHTINGIRYVSPGFPMECHMKLMGSQFRTLREAAEKKGLAMLSSLWKFSGEDNASVEALLASHDAISKNAKIPALTPHSVVISQLLPENTMNYFRYEGTTTSSPIYDSTNTVFSERAQITRKQMFILTDIYDEIGNPIVYNNTVTIRSKPSPVVYFNGDKNSCKCLKFP